VVRSSLISLRNSGRNRPSVTAKVALGHLLYIVVGNIKGAIMLAKYWPLLPTLILCILCVVIATSLHGYVSDVMYGLAGAAFLIFLWQIISFVSTARKEKTEK
jgi:hypothetical protein